MLNLKKFVSIIISLALCMSFGSLAYAEDQTDENLVLTYEGGQIELYNDAECSVPYKAGENIPAGSTVYYKICCEDGYFCYSVKINSGDADDVSFTMPNAELKIIPVIYRLGDTDDNGKIDLQDVSSFLKYLAGHADCYFYLIAGSPCGDAYLDFNRDGKVNVSDAAEMLRYIAQYKGVGTAPESETGFKVLSSVDNDSIYQFATVLPNSECIFLKPHELEYNQRSKMLYNHYDFVRFVYNTIYQKDNFYDIDESGQLIPSQINLDTLYELYNEEFFESYDLIAKVLHADCNITVDTVYRDQRNIIIDIDASESDQIITNKYWYILVAVPKGSVDSAVITSNSEMGMALIRENQEDYPVSVQES